MANKSRFSTLFSSALLFTLLDFSFAAPSPALFAVSTASAPPDRPDSNNIFAKFVALGDSYASGIGAGVRYTGGDGNRSCNRFEGAYSFKLKDNPRVRAASFDFLSCSGSRAIDIERNQVPNINQAADFITLTVGGNNVGFGNVVNACVYRFMGSFGDGCDKVLDDTRGLINDDNNLRNPLSNAIKAILTRAPNARVYVTGYARFWNAATTQCDTVTWNYWSVTGDKMTRARRQRMNDLTLALNGKVKDAVQGLSSSFPGRVVFVDYDAPFEGHRFCEEGVTEPQRSNDPRPNMYFFQLKTPVGSLVDTNNPDSDLPDFAPPSYPANQYYDSIKSFQAANPSAKVNPIYEGMNITTDSNGGIWVSITKIFHPTSPGHVLISNAIAASIPSNPQPGGQPLGVAVDVAPGANP
jgi:lysophospholipase L1-like esterase